MAQYWLKLQEDMLMDLGFVTEKLSLCLLSLFF